MYVVNNFNCRGFGPLLEDKLCLIFKLAPSVCRMTFPILASLLVRLVVLLPFKLLRLSLATPSRWTTLALSVFLHCVVDLLFTLLYAFLLFLSLLVMLMLIRVLFSFTFYVSDRLVYGVQWIKFMKDGVNATPLQTVNTTGYIDHDAFLGTINPDTNKIPKHLFQGYVNIYNNYFKAPWMPDRTEANPNELNQDDARYGFRCCHLKNIWTAPLPPETELSRQITTSTTSTDIMGLQAPYANLHTDQERNYFMQRYHDVISSFGGKTSYDADN